MTTTTTTEDLKKLYKLHEKEILQDYFTFLRFPSVSTESTHKPQVLACADWLATYLKKMGLEVQKWETSGHPTIFASYMKAGPDKPTLLLYNHYDVQPVDPVAEWKSPPFEPTIRNGEVYARGAQDNKGQCFYTIQAVKLMLEQEGTLPVNLKWIIEGEEEAGSAGLDGILNERRKELQADYLAIIDVGLRGPDKPSVTLGVRGLFTMDVEVQGSNTDLHSGCHGGLVYNPIHALVELLSSLRDKEGKIAVPGFYNDLVELTEKEKKQISWEFDETAYEKMFDSKITGGEKAYTPQERNWIRPTLEINGIFGGYTGTGFKTVIPAKAHAKISCRLVPNQDPQKIGRLVAQFLESRAPEGTKVCVKVHGGGISVQANPSSKIVKAFSKAFQEVFSKPCECIYEGASIPIVAKLASISKSELILVGLGLADDQIHAPNEHFGVDRMEKGFLVISRMLHLLAQASLA